MTAISLRVTLWTSLSGEFRPVLDQAPDELAVRHGLVQQGGDLDRGRGETFHWRVVQVSAVGRGSVRHAAQLQAHPVSGGDQLSDDEEVQRHLTAVWQGGMSSSSSSLLRFFIYTYIFISWPLAFLLCSFFNLLCNSPFERGHLKPWRYRNAFIIVLTVLVPLLCRVGVWRYTPPCSTVVHFLHRQSLLYDIVPRTFRPSSLRLYSPPSLFYFHSNRPHSYVIINL